LSTISLGPSVVMATVRAAMNRAIASLCVHSLKPRAPTFGGSAYVPPRCRSEMMKTERKNKSPLLTYQCYSSAILQSVVALVKQYGRED
jgi:hypothetical protein